MGDIKLKQLLWLITATLFTGGMLYFVTYENTITAIAWAYTSIMSGFIGIDIAVMIKKTSEMHNGMFKELNAARYNIAMLLFGLLLIESFYLGSIGRDVNGLIASFGLGFLFIIGGRAIGIEANKHATNEEIPE